MNGGQRKAEPDSQFPGCSDLPGELSAASRIADLRSSRYSERPAKRRCRVTVLGKLFTPIVPLFTKQRNW